MKTIRFYAGALTFVFLLVALALPAAADPECFFYSGDIEYCTVVKIKDGVCVNNTWAQAHFGKTGSQCQDCWDAVDNDQDVLVDHTETPVAGCVPSNNCQFGAVYGICRSF